MAGSCSLQMRHQVVKELLLITSSPLFPLVPRLIGDRLLHLLAKVQEVQNVQDIQGNHHIHEVQEVQELVKLEEAMLPEVLEVIDEKKEVHEVLEVKDRVCHLEVKNTDYRDKVVDFDLKNKFLANEPNENLKNIFENVPFIENALTLTNEHESKINLKQKAKIVPKAKCSQCDKTFCDKYMLKTHINRDHKGLTLSCPLCGKETMSMRRHLTIKHAEKAQEYLKNSKGVKRLVAATAMKVEKYSLEWYSFGTFQKFDKDLNGKLVCPVCKRGYNKFSVRNHMRYMHLNDKAYPKHKCQTCGKDVCDLPRHIAQVHEKKRTRVCVQCEFSCCGQSQLNQHIEMKHEGVKYTCEMCGALVVNLTSHTWQVHKKNFYKHSCDMCDKKFGITRDLSRHKRAMHTGKVKRGEPCNLCNLRCKVLDMPKHLATKHKQTFPICATN